MRIHLLKWITALAAWHLQAAPAVTDKPDPIALLAGVESARMQVPPSRLKLRVLASDPSGTKEQALMVEFDGQLRGFTCPGSETPYRTLFDGSHAICYEEHSRQIAYHSLTDGGSMALFDPRLIGLTTSYAWAETIQDVVPYKSPGCQATVVGEEDVEGRHCWHIRLGIPLPKYHATNRVDFWIDGKARFRVYRRDWNHVVTLLYYENSRYPWLPSRVVSKEYVNRGTGRWEERATKEIRVLEAEPNVRFTASRWTLQGLQATPGTLVADANVGQHIGTWSGTRIIQRDALRSKWLSSRWSGVILAVILAVFGSLLFLGILFLARRRLQRPRHPPPSY
jgi:hypothetical protein